MSRVERVFVLKTDSDALPLPAEYLAVAEEIFAHAQATIPVKLSTSIVHALADHIHITILRYRQNLSITNMMLHEIKRFYRDEFAAGVFAVDLVNKRFDVAMTEDEAGFIALHLVNAELSSGENTGNLSSMTNIIHEIENIVRMHYLTNIDVESDSYRRFMTHLKFFSERVFRQSPARSSTMGRVLSGINATYPKAAACVQRISEFLAVKYHHTLTDDERLYLTIHGAHIMSAD